MGYYIQQMHQAPFGRRDYFGSWVWKQKLVQGKPSTEAFNQGGHERANTTIS